MSKFELGQRVTMSGTAEKARTYEGKTHYNEGPIPFRVEYPKRREYGEGVIVGSRTVIDGHAWSDVDYGRQFTPIKGSAQRVWLVAFDLRRKPVMCFDHQLAEVTL